MPKEAERVSYREFGVGEWNERWRVRSHFICGKWVEVGGDLVEVYLQVGR